MNQKKVSLIISPRDRYTGLSECIDNVYEYTDESLFDLIILDLGYPKKELELAQSRIANKNNARIVKLERMIPLAGVDKIRGELTTPFTFLLDNDSRVSQGWLPPLIETGEAKDAAVISPLTLEKDGADGDYTRNHIYTVEIRTVAVEGKTYLIEHKPYRRELPENMPNKTVPSQAFELHGVMFNTKALQNIELPHMTIREHLDIGMQLKAKGEKIFAEPRSVIYFDNLGTRAQLADLKYFDLRWNKEIGKESHDLFEKRWGYKWYAEESVYFWCVRRRLYIILRWAFLPIKVANLLDRIVSSIKRRLFPIWDPVQNPLEQSSLLYDQLEGGKPIQLSHDLTL
ncbi:MAG: glycosyltransferase [Methylococcales bacterium]|nr:glycosyltransferase [Methylococcales bacterium]